ncbi:LD-carboxypeptidase [Lentisphaera profundi]|uniref:LD-carboxypeptidase n=1 Tax=Lentisphaera profundi TaxID=1658616 RepID=A0ABY7VTI6_9BACT|nr:LD-carboxypeptidase [Lentisphaera profundi]WDE97069.1 LD-carboxypeptidase [Lentisphaera profundi]
MKSEFQLIAPAGKASDDKLAAASPAMEAFDYHLKKDYFYYSPLSYLAAPDKQRAESLTDAWLGNDPLICLRGGYGCARLLDMIDWDSLRSSQNILIGHSDITALHLAFLKHGLKRTISGIMAAAEFTRSPDTKLTLKSFDQCLRGELFSHTWSPAFSTQESFKVSGKLIPVTLSVLTSLIGSQHLPDFENSILILEDINEAPYKIDRMLHQLKQSQLIDSVSAIVMGDFNNCGQEHELHEVFADFAKDFSFPIIDNLPFGHCLPRLNLPVGAEAMLELETNKEATLTITRY